METGKIIGFILMVFFLMLQIFTGLFRRIKRNTTGLTVTMDEFCEWVQDVCCMMVIAIWLATGILYRWT